MPKPTCLVPCTPKYTRTTDYDKLPRLKEIKTDEIVGLQTWKLSSFMSELMKTEGEARIVWALEHPFCVVPGLHPQHETENGEKNIPYPSYEGIIQEPEDE